jgi:putative peptidoglycan lipid II flippase
MDEFGRITRAAGVVGVFTLLSRITGLLRDIVLGYLFGARGAADAFFVAFRIPNLLRRLTAEGALAAGFVPVFTESLARDGRAEAARVARIAFTFTALAVGIITALGVVFAGPLAQLFAPGFAADPPKFSLTVKLTRIMFPYILLVSLVSLAMGVLNSVRHFTAPALSPVLLNLSIVACALLLSPVLTPPVTSLAYGVLLGGVAQLLLQLPYLKRHGFAYAPDLDFRHPVLRRMLWLMGPAAFGAAVYQVNILVSMMLASLLPEGSVSYLYYADRILEFPVGVFAIALGTAALPSFSSLAARGARAELRASFVRGLRLVNLICLPATFGLIVVALPVFSLFFQRGAFDATAAAKSSEALVFFALGLWAISASKLAVAAFYALQDTKTPVVVSAWSFLLNFLLSVAFMGPVEPRPDMGALGRTLAACSRSLSVLSLSHGGLALATSVSSTFGCIALLILLHRRLGGLCWREFFVSFAYNLAASVLMALPLLLWVRRFEWSTGDRNALLLSGVFAAILASGVGLFALLSLIFRNPDRELLRELRRRA